MTSKIAMRVNIAAGFPASAGNAVATFARSAWQLAIAAKRRRELKCLVDLDDRMLADIRVSRDDLRDALSEPFWRDPTALLASRVDELRTDRGRRAPSKAALTQDSQRKTGTRWAFDLSRSRC